jgi:hypothetical protein
MLYNVQDNDLGKLEFHSWSWLFSMIHNPIWGINYIQIQWKLICYKFSDVNYACNGHNRPFGMLKI